MATTSNEVLSWTSQDPRQSQLFGSYGVLYRFQTDTNNQGQVITTLWRAIRANKEDRVAKLEWAPNGGLGRAVIGKSTLPMADLVRRDPHILLQDQNDNVIAFYRPIRPQRYNIGDVHGELHFVRNAGAGVVMHPPLMDTVTVTAMLYRYATAYGL
ncbi:hypothetical protein BN946_scf185043.g105 [Trametes cinnabarina]|uniref:Uncharacterized protein n=1 Tax=Pycnoporus cinnabarinus TaxID=5643 RepID=A0A060SI10_PYCCI|nr:hypothetical protein BN946_scf185043.g105 [Trametes cinnabarina]